MDSPFTRRKFIAGVSASALAAVYPPSFLQRFEEHSSSNAELNVIRPKALKPGDTIGIVVPASNVYELEDIAMGREIVESLGSKTVLGKNISAQYSYLVGKDADRAADLNEMFRRGDVDGIICLRGDWRSMRLLPMLDYEMMRENPKVLMGHSDITSLLLAVYEHAGIVIGKLTDYVPNEYKPAFTQTLSMEEILRTRIESLNVPSLYGLMIGHIKDKITVPLDVRATLNADGRTFSIDESAVQ